MDLLHRLELLRCTRLLRAAPDSLLKELAEGCESMRFGEGEVLFEEGDPGDALYVVNEGTLEIFLGDTVLDVSGRGACLGEMALLTEDRRTASIRAATESTVLRLSRPIFRDVLDRHPELAWGIFRELADKVKSSIRVRVKQHEFARRLEEAFARSVSRTVMDEILSSVDADQLLSGSTKIATVLFADVRSFTNVSELLPPEQVIELLNEYLSAMVDVILDHEGTLDKFMGDGILAHFGIPLGREDDALRAVRCAIAMQERIEELNLEGEHMKRNPLRVGIGLATGDLVAGCIGSERRMDYTAIGDTVNLASRVESLTKLYQCRILVCDATLKQLGEKIAMRRVDRVRVKGRSQPSELSSPVDEGDDPVAVNAYEGAFGLYEQGEFAEAAGLFDACSDGLADRSAVTLASRCRVLKEQSPEDWDGIFTLAAK